MDERAFLSQNKAFMGSHCLQPRPPNFCAYRSIHNLSEMRMMINKCHYTRITLVWGGLALLRMWHAWRCPGRCQGLEGQGWKVEANQWQRSTFKSWLIIEIKYEFQIETCLFEFSQQSEGCRTGLGAAHLGPRTGFSIGEDIWVTLIWFLTFIPSSHLSIFSELKQN